TRTRSSRSSPRSMSWTSCPKPGRDRSYLLSLWEVTHSRPHPRIGGIAEAAGRGHKLPRGRSHTPRGRKTMAIQLGDVAPDFTQESTEGSIKFHDWLGGSWGVLFSH